MAIKESTGRRFDTEQLRRALEERDVEAMLDLLAEEAEMRTVNRHATPKSPLTRRGRKEIEEALRDVFGRDMQHKLRNVVVEGDRAAYEELCTYPDGTQVLGISMLDLKDGRIIRHTSVEAWDE
ncbi:nuclear transport factor 2 family protein [Allosalinactinospora lopnorensis]|uniref:nuclear transport factor 2 family protein n=1 Tax=Allosalinactinospora lopnorensis TaxID=1352348 RepID=UPI000623E976|nr:nuclear transport factor 2 family protein [Allosalinactinospora lopnorensis]